MKIKAYNTTKMETISEYETNEIIALGDDLTSSEKNEIKNGATPMLNFITTDNRNMAIPIQLLISITE